MDGVYMCDPRKNNTCRGTVCFYDDGCEQHLCFTCIDPDCAVIGADGEPVTVDIGGLDDLIMDDKKS